MKKEYDLSKMKMRKNPYASKLKRQVTIRMGDDVVSYFKELADETGIPYQTLINLYLCLLYTSPSPRDQRGSRMPSSA